MIVAYWISSEIGLDATHDLRRTLSAADEAALVSLASKDQGWPGVSARIALDVMQGASLGDAYARHRR